MNILEKAKENFLKKENNLSEYATKSSEAIRLENIIDNDIRPSFYRDIDRIIHSLSYSRYIDKTQVYSYQENAHISKRMIHVQLVSKIARTIGRALNLNEDLIEAIALGHDIGHTPLGHVGEELLNEISKREIGETFAHNIQSVRHFMFVENNGKGLNLTIQVLDGIMCHNGEMLFNEYIKEEKTKEDFYNQYLNAYTDIKTSKKNRPMTLEGCVVRISDIIGYIGRDIEDAINLGLFERNNLPKQITDVLGYNNKDIINTIVIDIINNSLDKPYIKMSERVYKALIALKKFNYENIYDKSLASEDKEYYRQGMNKIYTKYLNDIKDNNKNSIIYTIFLNKQNNKYIENTSPERMVIDFIAGMTDDLFLSEIKKD